MAEGTIDDFLSDVETAYKNFDITDLELDVWIISMASLIFVPLCFGGNKKIRYAVFGLLSFIFIIDLSMFLRMFIMQKN